MKNKLITKRIPSLILGIGIGMIVAGNNGVLFNISHSAYMIVSLIIFSIGLVLIMINKDGLEKKS